jgi:hypothetical protein
MAPFRIAVLTTDTPHHRYFLRRLGTELSGHISVAQVLFEQRPYPWRQRAWRHWREKFPNPWHGIATNPYLQPALLGKRVDRWERARFFPDGDDRLPAGTPCDRVWSVNEALSRDRLMAAKPDLIVVYGTGRVAPEIYQMAPAGAVNAHGGKLPEYRGLDTNLWAALQGRPQDMRATWHTVEREFDTGAVYVSRSLPKAADLDLDSIRGYAAEVCTDLLIELMPALAAGSATVTPQSGAGRYYGPMPWLLKRKAEQNLRQWVRS